MPQLIYYIQRTSSLQVTKIHVGHQGANDRIGMGRVLYSMDSVNWIDGEDMDLPTNYTNDHVYEIKSPQEARRIRIVVSILLNLTYVSFGKEHPEYFIKPMKISKSKQALPLTSKLMKRLQEL